MDDGVQGADGLGGDRGLIEPSQSPQRRQAGGDVGRGVGVQGRPAALVPGVEGGEHVAHLGAAALPQNDAVGPHAQGRAHERGHGHRPDALDVVATLLEVDDMGVVGAQLGGLLDAHNALGGADQAEEGRQEGRLAGAGRPGDQAGGPRPNELGQHRVQAERDRPGLDELVQGEGTTPLGAQADERAVGGQGRQDRVEAGAVGQGRVHHRAGIVQPAPAGGGHTHRERTRPLFRQGGGVDALQAAAAVDPGAPRPDEDVGDAVGLQQRLEHGARALDVGAHAAAQAGQAAGAGGGRGGPAQSALQADAAGQRPAHGGELVSSGAPRACRASGTRCTSGGACRASSTRCAPGAVSVPPGGPWALPRAHHGRSVPTSPTSSAATARAARRAPPRPRVGSSPRATR